MNHLQGAIIALDQALASSEPARAGGRTIVDAFMEILTIINNAMLVGALLGILVIVYAGILYITSSGDDTKIKTAKDLIAGAISGLILLLMIRILIPLIGVFE